MWPSRNRTVTSSRRLLILFFPCLVSAACTTYQGTPSACNVVPPQTVVVERERIAQAQTTITDFVSQKMHSASLSNTFNSVSTETYKIIQDRDVACAMMLRTLTCLSERGASPDQIKGLHATLQKSQSCDRINEARVSVDSIVQINVDEAALYHKSLAFDLFLRNSGDQPALLHKASIWFDEHLRPERGPANLQPVTAVYLVAVDGKGAEVQGADFNSPVKAWYPGPGSPVLILEVPIAQTLPPRSTDRFRVKINFSEGAERRGPLEQLRVELEVNDQPTAISSGLLGLKEQPRCLTFAVPTKDGSKASQFCPENL